MFVLLNRCLKGIVWLLLVGALWLAWTQRERGRPLVDLYASWEKAGYRTPEPLARSQGTVGRVISENIVEFRDNEGRTWNVGLCGLAGVNIDGRNPMLRQFAASTRTNLAERLVGRRVEMAWVSTNTDRSALGFAYVIGEPHSVAMELVAEGRLRLLPDDIVSLPLLEQVYLRGAERRARLEQRGLWGLEAETTKTKVGS